MVEQLFLYLKNGKFADVVKIALKERDNSSFDRQLKSAIERFDTIGILKVVANYNDFLERRDNVFDVGDNECKKYKCKYVYERNLLADAMKIKVIEMLMVKFDEEHAKIGKLAGY